MGSRTRRTTEEASGQPRTVQLVGGTIEANWELDFVGRVRRNIEAHGAEVAASAADLAALQIAIVGEVAATYVELRGLRECLRVARENLQTQQSTLALVTARLDSGRGTDFDVARARAKLEGTASRVPALEALITVHQHRLAVLTGRAPQALIAELDESAPQLALPPDVNPGTPAALLRRRPDVRAAEERLHAATARVGVATADLFPRVSLGGLIGTLHRKVAACSIARAKPAAGCWASTGPSLMSGVCAPALPRARPRPHAKATSPCNSRTRMDVENIDLFEVLDTQRTQLAAQDARADSHMRSLRAAVALHQALAGGWPQQSARTTSTPESATPLATADEFACGTTPSTTTGTAGFHPAASAPTETAHAY